MIKGNDILGSLLKSIGINFMESEFYIICKLDKTKKSQFEILFGSNNLSTFQIYHFFVKNSFTERYPQNPI